MTTDEERTEHLVRTGNYTRQPWTCLTCGARGEILTHKDDTLAQQQWRMEQSHDAQGRRRCRNPQFNREAS